MPNRTDIIAAARGWCGTPYRHQGSMKGVGADCLGLVRGVWRECYGSEPEAVPAYSADWAECNGEETLAHAARRHMREIMPESAGAGDLVLFRWRAHLPAKHAGILTGHDRMVHAQDGASVSEVWLSPWWRRRMAFAFQFPDLS